MFKDFFSSLGSYGQSFKLISELKLWKYFFVPILIGFVLFSVTLILTFSLADRFGNWIDNIWFWDWGKETFSVISDWVGGIIILILGYLLMKHLLLAFSSPFMSPVSEKVEMHLTKKEVHVDNSPKEFVRLLIRGLKVNLRNLILELLFTLPLLLIGLIPVLNVASVILIFVVQSYYAGFGNMDYTLERYFNESDSVKFVKRHKGLALGNGAVFMLFLFIPVVGVFLALPFSTVASTIDTINRLEENKN